MLKKHLAVAAICTTLLAWGIAATCGRLDDPVTGSAGVEPPTASPDSTPLDPAGRMASETVTRQEVQVSAPEEPTASDMLGAPIEVGHVTGTVFHRLGQPFPKQSVHFVRSDTSEEGLTDALGRYWVRDLPAGTYEVRYVDDVHVAMGRCATIIGQVEVRAGETSTFDLLLQHSRTLTGSVRLLDHANVCVELQLRDATRPELVVARGKTISASAEEMRAEAHRRRIARDSGGEALRDAAAAVPKPVRNPPLGFKTHGYFRMTNLRPAIYVLRIGLEGNERFYEDVEVDLIAGDVELPPLELDLTKMFKGPFTEEELRNAK